MLIYTYTFRISSSSFCGYPAVSPAVLSSVAGKIRSSVPQNRVTIGSLNRRDDFIPNLLSLQVCSTSPALIEDAQVGLPVEDTEREIREQIAKARIKDPRTVFNQESNKKIGL